MTTNGVPQTSGVQRRVDFPPADESLQVGIRDRNPGPERVTVRIPAASLMTVLSEQPKGVQSVPGTDGGTLDVEVRRNEVWLTIGGADAAVGLDDLMNVLASVLPGG